MSIYDYDSDFSSLEEAVSGLTGVSLGSNLLSVAIGIVSYVLLAIGLYTIAKRRGIRHPWMAWVPVADVWLLGCISDQYRYVARGQEKSKRKLMLIFEIVTLVLAVAVMVLMAVALINLFGQIDLELWMNDDYIPGDFDYLGEVLGPMLGACGLSMVMCGFAIALAVLQYMAVYDVFASCDPVNKTLFTALGIVLSCLGLGIVLSIFVFVCRKKDLGMPPRRDQMFNQPFQPPVDQPTWQSSQPPVEPWDQNRQ